MNRTLVIAISILLAFCASLYFWTEWQKKEFDASLPEPPAVEEQQVAEDTVDDVAGDTAGGHWHGDEWHAEPHRDAVLDEGMHFTDLREQIDVLETGNPDFQESPTYELPPGISHEDARRVHEAYKKWDREVRQPARDEWLELTEGEQPLALRLKGEKFIEYFSSLSETEHEKAIAEMEAHLEKQQAAWERYQAVERDKPDFVTEVLGGE